MFPHSYAYAIIQIVNNLLNICFSLQIKCIISRARNYGHKKQERDKSLRTRYSIVPSCNLNWFNPFDYALDTEKWAMGFIY